MVNMLLLTRTVSFGRLHARLQGTAETHSSNTHELSYVALSTLPKLAHRHEQGTRDKAEQENMYVKCVNKDAECFQ